MTLEDEITGTYNSNYKNFSLSVLTELVLLCNKWQNQDGQEELVRQWDTEAQLKLSHVY